MNEIGYTINEVTLDAIKEIKCGWNEQTYQVISCLDTGLGIRSNRSSERKIKKSKDKISEKFRRTQFFSFDN